MILKSGFVPGLHRTVKPSTPITDPVAWIFGDYILFKGIIGIKRTWSPGDGGSTGFSTGLRLCFGDCLNVFIGAASIIDFSGVVVVCLSGFD